MKEPVILPINNPTQYTHIFYCPGCKEGHGINTTPGRRPLWQLSGTPERPTITPSILHPGRCHCFVTDGKIQFLNDCTHALAGQTVDLQPL